MAVKEEPQDPKPIEVEDPFAGLAPVSPTPATKIEAQAAQESILNIMRDKFAVEPRVRVKVHNDGPVPVQINGYSFLIQEGVWVEVPESVRDALDEAGYI